MYIPAADKVKPVIVMDDTVMDMQSFHFYKLALYNPYGMESALKKEDIPDGEVLALMEQ